MKDFRLAEIGLCQLKNTEKSLEIIKLFSVSTRKICYPKFSDLFDLPSIISNRKQNLTHQCTSILNSLLVCLKKCHNMLNGKYWLDNMAHINIIIIV